MCGGGKGTCRGELAMAFLGFVLWWMVVNRGNGRHGECNGATDLPLVRWPPAGLKPLRRSSCSRRHSRLVAGGAGRSRPSSLTRRGGG